MLRHPRAYVSNPHLLSPPLPSFANTPSTLFEVEPLLSTTVRRVEIELAFVKFVASAALLVLWRVKRGLDEVAEKSFSKDGQGRGARKAMGLLIIAIKDSLEELFKAESDGEWKWGPLGALKVWGLVIGFLEGEARDEEEDKGKESQPWFRRELHKMITEKGGVTELEPIYEGVLWVGEVQGERLREVMKKLGCEDGRLCGL